MTSLFSTKNEFIGQWLSGFYPTKYHAFSSLQKLNKERIENGLTLDHIHEYMESFGAFKKQTTIRNPTNNGLRQLGNVARVYSGLRTKKATLLVENSIQAIYPIRINPIESRVHIGTDPVINDRPDASRYLDLYELNETQLQDLATLEGFKSLNRFFDFFDQDQDQDHYPFHGYLFSLSQVSKTVISSWK